MAVYAVDPLEDARWTALAASHPCASAFHSRGWLEALRRTYGYEPVALTTSPPRAELRNALLFCRVKSWITGRRLVSLPFSDHCQPLVDDAADLSEILEHARRLSERERLRYVEIRPCEDVPGMDGLGEAFGRSGAFFLHRLDLRADPETIFRGFHKSCVQRSIRRAEREGLRLASGGSEDLVEGFYRLMVLTRRRHGLPPQPKAWFRNLVSCMGDSIAIRVAWKGDAPVAAIVTLSHGRGLIYKYGCSDERYFSLGGIFALFWQMIQEGKAAGAQTLDLGRSDLDAPGLIQFKDRWGAERLQIRYYRYPAPRASGKEAPGRARVLAGALLSRLPDPLLILAGRALYRHIG